MARAKGRPPRRPSRGKSAGRTVRAKPRPGLPDKSSVVSVKTLVSPKGNRYRIIETDETDAYDSDADRPRKSEK